MACYTKHSLLCSKTILQSHLTSLRFPVSHVWQPLSSWSDLSQILSSQLLLTFKDPTQIALLLWRLSCPCFQPCPGRHPFAEPLLHHCHSSLPQRQSCHSCQPLKILRASGAGWAIVIVNVHGLKQYLIHSMCSAIMDE